MKNLLKISLVLLVLVICSSCSLFNEDFTFENLSSYVVHVSPNGQNWHDFYLSPGQSNSVENTGNYDSISYIYCTTSGEVRTVKSYNKITFYNK